jgi:hypothetical protein
VKSKVPIYVLAVLAVILGVTLLLVNNPEAIPALQPKPSATPSPSATELPTLADSPTAIATATVTSSPTPSPSPTSAFASLADLVSIPSGEVYDLWVSTRGDLWVAAANGLFRHNSDGNYQRLSDKAFSRILGMDNANRLWVLSQSGESILSYNGTTWAVYGPGQGWEPVQVENLPGGLAADLKGGVWLATGGDDLRHLQAAGGRWESLSAVDIGFTPADPLYQGHYLTKAVLAPDGSIWVGDCIGMGEGFDGQGIRYYKDGDWEPLAGTAGECVKDIVRDAQGRMWVGAFDKLLRYDTISGSWTQMPLPAWDRRQIVTSIQLDPAGDPWLGILKCGAAACDTLAYYFLKNGAWTPFLDESTEYWSRPGLGFTPDRGAWICHEGNVYLRSETSGYSLVGSLETGTCRVAVDGTGSVWVAAASGPSAGLWQVKP